MKLYILSFPFGKFNNFKKVKARKIRKCKGQNTNFSLFYYYPPCDWFISRNLPFDDSILSRVSVSKSPQRGLSVLTIRAERVLDSFETNELSRRDLLCTKRLPLMISNFLQKMYIQLTFTSRIETNDCSHKLSLLRQFTYIDSIYNFIYKIIYTRIRSLWSQLGFSVSADHTLSSKTSLLIS